MSESAATSYDEMPYTGSFIPMTHPDGIATTAVLHGMMPAPVERCRVLELGCCDGGNLLAIAQGLPRASFLGVDLSPRQVADGQETIRSLGVKNVELRALDLSAIDASFGLFDYIICHGVYSWVSDPVRDRILQICKRNLAPSGVAYVSYNTYPGWGPRGMIRRMMRYHVQDIADPRAQVQQARALLDFVARFADPPDGPYANYLREEIRKIEKFADTYLYHEFLEDRNEPVEFHEFAARAVAAGLRYLGHAIPDVEEAKLPEEFRQAVSQLGDDLIRREQYLDFVLNRCFRQSLLCHAGIKTYERPWNGAVSSLWFAALSRPENSTPDLATDAKEPFHTMRGQKVMIDEPLVKAMLVVLYQQWPRSLDFQTLRAGTLALLGLTEDSPAGDPDEFSKQVFRCHFFQLLSMQSYDQPIVTEPGERPLVSALARWRAARNEPVISLRNHYTALEDVDRLVLPLLDGSRDLSAIAGGLMDAVSAGKLTLQSGGKPLTKPAAIQEGVASIVPSSLRRIADQALLVAD